MKLYEYVVWIDEKRDKDDNVVSPAEVLVGPSTMLANDEKTVGFAASRAIPDSAATELDRIQVVIRPFG